MGWETVELWRARSEAGVWELRLLHLDHVWSQAWRVEWGWQGHQRRGQSYSGEGREERARAEIERRKVRHGGEWHLVG